MTLKEHKQASNITGVWSFLVWFIKTKEFKWVLLAVVIILIYNPDWIVKFKIALMNLILNWMR
jgi:hypothetical protein